MTPRRVQAVVLLALLLVTMGAWAQVFRWVDDDGNVNYAGDREQVPEKYRSQLSTEVPLEEPARPVKPGPRVLSEQALRPAPGECVLRIARTRERPAVTRSYPSCEACQKALEAARSAEPGRAVCALVDQ